MHRPWTWSSYGHIRSNCTISKGYVVSPSFGNVILFILNICFANKRRCGIKTLGFVHVTHHALKCMKKHLHSNIQAGNAKNQVYHFFIDDCTKLAVSTPCIMMKFIWYNLLSHSTIAIILQWEALIMYSSRLNYTFKFFDKSLLIESKTLQLGHMEGSLDMIFLLLLFINISTTMKPIIIVFTMLLSSKRMLRKTITSYVSTTT